MSKVIKLILGAIIILLVGASIYLLIINLYLRKEIAVLGEKDENGFTRRIAQEREVLHRSFEEKYREELLSAENKYKELDREIKKRRELEEKSRESGKQAKKD